MEPKVIESGPITLVGFSFFGNPFELSGDWSEENEIGRLWVRFMAFLSANSGRIEHLQNTCYHYELHITHPDTVRTGEYEVFVGLEIGQVAQIPVELSIKVLPATTYAVFTFRGEEIKSDWQRAIYKEWMANSPYESADTYGFERYDERFLGTDRISESELDVFVPIRMRQIAG